MRVGIFKNVKWATQPEETELDKIVYMMQFSQELCARTLKYRKYLAWGRKKRVEDMKISIFPAFIPCAMMNGGKARKDVVGLTDLCYLDIDHIKNEKLIRNTMNMLRNDENVVMASRSISGHGIHILIRYQLKNTETEQEGDRLPPKKMQEIYGKVFNHLAVMYMMKLGLETDMHAGHIEHMYILAYDYELYYNPNAEPLMVDLNESINSEAFETYVLQIDKRISESEELITLNRMDEAERMLQECRHWISCISNYCDEDMKQDLIKKLPGMEDYLEKITQTKGIVARVNKLMDEVDEDLNNENTIDAHDKIEESKKMIKAITGIFRQAIAKTRQRIMDDERKLGSINRVIKKDRRVKNFLGKRKFIIKGDEEYRQALLYLIKKFECLQKVYEQGDLDICEDILDIISTCMDELPEDINKEVLQERYEYWESVVKIQGKDSDRL